MDGQAARAAERSKAQGDAVTPARESASAHARVIPMSALHVTFQRTKHLTSRDSPRSKDEGPAKKSLAICVSASGAGKPQDCPSGNAELPASARAQAYRNSRSLRQLTWKKSAMRAGRFGGGCCRGAGRQQ